MVELNEKLRTEAESSSKYKKSVADLQQVRSAVRVHFTPSLSYLEIQQFCIDISVFNSSIVSSCVECLCDGENS